MIAAREFGPDELWVEFQDPHLGVAMLLEYIEDRLDFVQVMDPDTCTQMEDKR